jgi:hypothetical protein
MWFWLLAYLILAISTSLGFVGSSLAVQRLGLPEPQGQGCVFFCTFLAAYWGLWISS